MAFRPAALAFSIAAAFAAPASAAQPSGRMSVSAEVRPACTVGSARLQPIVCNGPAPLRVQRSAPVRPATRRRAERGLSFVTITF